MSTLACALHGGRGERRCFTLSRSVCRCTFLSIPEKFMRKEGSLLRVTKGKESNDQTTDEANVSRFSTLHLARFFHFFRPPSLQAFTHNRTCSCVDSFLFVCDDVSSQQGHGVIREIPSGQPKISYRRFWKDDYLYRLVGVIW